MRRILLAFLCLAGLALAADPAPVKDTAAQRAVLLNLQRQYQLQLAATRERLLKDDDEIRDLNERLQRLQQQLLKALEARKEMADLRQKADAVAADLEALDQKSANTPAK